MIKTTAAHEKLFQAICEVIKTEAADMPVQEILAVVSNIVGKLIAMQDQRKYSPEVIMEMVGRNIEKGNQQIINELRDAPTGRPN